MIAVKRGLLLAVVCACVLVVAQTRKPHVYEFAHFWVTAKYFPELGYEGLYAGLAVALEENYGTQWLRERARAVRDLESGRLVPAERVLARGRSLRERWDQRRWSAFLADVRTLKEAMERYAPDRADRLWTEIFLDHGVNYPPPWIAYTHAICRDAPLTPASLTAFSALDAAFLAATLAAVASLWGLAGAAVAAVFVASAADLLSYATWAFCKLDWLALVALSLLALRSRGYALAGALYGLAAAVRVFPGPVGLLFALAWWIPRLRRGEDAGGFTRFSAGLGGGFIGAVALATLFLSVAGAGSPVGIWGAYAARLSHYSSVGRLVNRVGVRGIAEAAGLDGFGLVAGAASALLALLLFAVLLRRGREAVRTAALSLFFVPQLFAINHFYYLMLMLPLAAREPGLGWLAPLLVGVNLAVLGAKAVWGPSIALLELESLAYSLCVSVVPLALAIRPVGDSGTMAPAMRHKQRFTGQ